jgi:hypothetical protein
MIFLNLHNFLKSGILNYKYILINYIISHSPTHIAHIDSSYYSDYLTGGLFDKV